MEESMETSVVDYAVKLHSIFQKIINKYGEECVEELFPLCITMLENLNLHIEENENLLSANDNLTKKCEDLTVAMEKLKLQRQKDLEKSLGIEDDLEKELFDSQEKIAYLEQKLEHSLNDLSKNDETIAVLNDKLSFLQSQFENVSNNRLPLPNQMEMVRGEYYYSLQYPMISVHVPLALNFIEGLPVQKNPSLTTYGLKPQRKGRNRDENDLKNVSISLYSDSQGRDLSVLLKSQFRSKNVILKPCLVKPGAPLREVIRAIKTDASSFTGNEYIVMIGGSCDVGFNAEAHIVNDYSDLLNFKPECHLIISTIPPRYDLSPYSIENQEIRGINLKLRSLVIDHAQVKILDLGSKNRSFFTADGKRFNIKGKTSIVRDIYKIIKKW